MRRPKLYGSNWRPIPSNICMELEMPFTNEELQTLLTSLVIIEPYDQMVVWVSLCKRVWPIVKNYRVKIFMDFIENVILSRCNNKTYLCRIPKKTRVTKVADNQPICFVISIYKVVAKSLPIVLERWCILLFLRVRINRPLFQVDKFLTPSS